MDRGRNKQAKLSLDKTIGTNIRRERTVRKITRDELAEMLDLTTSHLGLIERGERGATPVTLKKIVDIFGVSIDSLVSEASRAIFARERRDQKLGVYHKKVLALMTHLTEPELELLTHTIKGVIGLRKSQDGAPAVYIAELEEDFES